MNEDGASPTGQTWHAARMREFLEGRARLLAYLQCLVRDPHTAEDLFQEVWLRFDAALREGREIGSVQPWCRGVARHLAQHVWRARQTDRVVVDTRLLELIDLAFEEQETRSEEAHERARCLESCLAKLPPRSRDLLIRRYDTGSSIDEIAARMEQSAGAVKTMLCRLRQILAECVQRQLRAEGDPI